jgi:micrococcal nuclease
MESDIQGATPELADGPATMAAANRSGRGRRSRTPRRWKPNSVPAIRSVQLSGTSSGVALTGTFRLCAMMHQPNCVVDGDTIRYGGVRIRLADIDAPEISDPKCASEAALGDRATQRLLQLLNAGPFQIVRAGGRDEDKYGRKLRIIVRDGRSVADALVSEGLARRWDGARRSWCA